jgi:hypothetical protein
MQWMQKFQQFLERIGKRINPRKSKSKAGIFRPFFLLNWELAFQLDQVPDPFFYSIHQNSILFGDELS